MKIAVLGPSQSGKTCLAVGLANTSYGRTAFRRAFVAKAIADSAGTLDDLRKRIEGAEWPDGTQKTDTFHFALQRKGRSDSVVFNDYKGEKSSDPGFLKGLEDVEGDWGVVLLVNPGFNVPCVREADGTVRYAESSELAAGARPDGYFEISAFDDSPLARKWLAGQLHVYERIVEGLETTPDGGRKTDKPAVALAVTASDRLRRRGDLRSVRPRFRAFLAQIENKLETAGFRWETFDVSITGTLADQSKPKLASGRANTAPRPFLWLLRDPARGARRRKAALGFAGAALALVFLLLLAWQWTRASRAGRDVACRVSACREALERTPFGAADLANAAGAVEALRGHAGFHAAKAAAKAAELEAAVWERQSDLIERRIRNVEESGGKLGSRKDFGDVDDLFDAFAPEAGGLAGERTRLRAAWNAKKPGLGDAHAEWTFGHEVEEPLRDSANGHGVGTMDALYRLSDKVRGQDPATGRLVARKAELGARLDDRIGAEWSDFAIPGFGAAAAAGASDEAVRAFVARLDAWEPATENGAAAKAGLAASVSNAVPAWRAAFETAAFSARTDEAVRSGDLERLARLYPPRVATNGFLAAEFVRRQWDERGRAAFERARKTRLDGVVSRVAARRGRPSLATDDLAEIDRIAAVVGEPFDGPGAQAFVAKAVEAKAAEWEEACRKAAEKWIKDEIPSNRKRTGQNGFWESYERFVRENGDNPFAGTLVREAVYAQAERWLASDVAAIRKLDCLDVSYRKQAEKAFDPFRSLCREIVRDRNPLRTSWAWHFAIACDKDAHLDRIASCFPQTLQITGVEGTVRYSDYRRGYWGTYLEGTLRIVAWDGTEKASWRMLDGAALEKKDNRSWKAFPGSARFEISLFDRIEIDLSAVDRNVSPGRELVCPVGRWSRQAWSCPWSEAAEFGGDFDLEAASLWPLTTKDPTPFAGVRLAGRPSGPSLDDFVENAKRAAERARSAR